MLTSLEKLMTVTPALRATGAMARTFVGKQRPDNELVAIADRLLRSRSDSAVGVIGGDPHLLRLGIEQGQRRCIGDRVANASIGAGHRDQKSNTMPLRVRRKTWLNGCGGGCRDFRSCGSAHWNHGLTARKPQDRTNAVEGQSGSVRV